MNDYRKTVEIRWSDLDPNFHLRHSVYYDWGAFVRMSFLTEYGLGPAIMLQNNIGPVILREEAIFKREIRFEDKVEVSLCLAKSTKDAGRWTMVHEIWKNKDTLSALLTIDGAWLDTQKRKLAIPPPLFFGKFDMIPKTENFAWA